MRQVSTITTGMNDYRFLFTTLVLVATLHHGLATLELADVPVESRLKHDLLQYYDSSVRPIWNTSMSTRVTIDMVPHQIIKVDEKEQTVRSTVWMRVYWRDEFLTWNSSNYGGVKSLKFDPSLVWIPDICIYDGLDPGIYTNGMTDFYITVDSDGYIAWFAPLVIETMCHLNVRFFPYDSQICNITLGSWTYNGLDIDVWMRNAEGDISTLKENIEWEVQDFNATREVTLFSCCPEPYPSVVFRLFMKRRPGFYITYLYLPCVVIIATSLFAFYLPPGSDSKIDLAVTGLLSQTVFLLLISDLLPPDANDPPFLGKCLAMLLVVQALAVVVIVILKRFHDDSMNKEHPPGPKFTTVLHYLKYPLLLWSLEFNRNKVTEETAKKNGYVPEKPKMDEANGRSPHLFKLESSNGNSKTSNWTHLNGNHPHSITSNDATTDKPSIREGHNNGIELLLRLDKILIEAKRVGEKSREQQLQEEVADQWRMVVTIYDRIMFVVFLIGILAITLWFLTIGVRE